MPHPQWGKIPWQFYVDHGYRRTLMITMSLPLLRTMTGTAFWTRLSWDTQSGTQHRQKWPRFFLYPFQLPLDFKSRWPESLYSAIIKLLEKWDCQFIHPHVGKPVCVRQRLAEVELLPHTIVTAQQYGSLDNRPCRKLPKWTFKMRYNTIMVCPQVYMNM